MSTWTAVDWTLAVMVVALVLAGFAAALQRDAPIRLPRPRARRLARDTYVPDQEKP